MKTQTWYLILIMYHGKKNLLQVGTGMILQGSQGTNSPKCNTTPGHPVQINAFVDADHAGNRVTH